MLDRGQGLVDVAEAMDVLFSGEETLGEDTQQPGFAYSRSTVERSNVPAKVCKRNAPQAPSPHTMAFR